MKSIYDKFKEYTAIKKKRILTIASFILLAFPFLMSCNSDKDNPTVEEEVEYFVKYEISTTPGGRHQDFLWHLEYPTGNGVGKAQVKNGSKWEASYGPFPKNYEIYLRIANGSTRLPANARIYVSKDNGPFIIKAEHTGADHVLRIKLNF